MDYEEEFQDVDLDDILEAIERKIAEEENGVSIINPDRMRDLFVCNEVLKKLFAGSGAIIQCTPHDIIPSTGVIRVRAKKFRTENTKSFVKVLKLATNYEIYPRLDGTFMFALSFCDMTKKVGDL